MERLAGRVMSIGLDPGGEHRVTIAVLDASAPSVGAAVYTLVIDADEGAMEPEDELADCFEVHHEHEHVEDLAPGLRRQWKTARIADEIIARLLRSGALGVVRADDDDA